MIHEDDLNIIENSWCWLNLRCPKASQFWWLSRGLILLKMALNLKVNYCTQVSKICFLVKMGELLSAIGNAIVNSAFTSPCRICRPSNGMGEHQGNSRVVDVLSFVLFFGGHFGEHLVSLEDTLISQIWVWQKRFLPQRWLPFIEIQIAAVFSTFRCVLRLNFLATGLLPLPSWFAGLSITLDLLCLILFRGWLMIPIHLTWIPSPLHHRTNGKSLCHPTTVKGKIEWKEHAIPPYWAASLWGKSFLQVCGWLAL